MDIDLITNEDNLSLIVGHVGHVGNHKNDYSRLLETQLIDIKKSMVKKYKAKYLVDGADEINEQVKLLIKEVKLKVTNKNEIMNDRKLFVLD